MEEFSSHGNSKITSIPLFKKLYNYISCPRGLYIYIYIYRERERGGERERERERERRRCSWCNGYRRRKWTWRLKFKS